LLDLERKEKESLEKLQQLAIEKKNKEKQSEVEAENILQQYFYFYFDLFLRLKASEGIQYGSIYQVHCILGL
jgi:hypothetical protein